MRKIKLVIVGGVAGGFGCGKGPAFIGNGRDYSVRAWCLCIFCHLWPALSHRRRDPRTPAIAFESTAGFSSALLQS
jgi:hypothetical protein